MAICTQPSNPRCVKYIELKGTCVDFLIRLQTLIVVLKAFTVCNLRPCGWNTRGKYPKSENIEIYTLSIHIITPYTVRNSEELDVNQVSCKGVLTDFTCIEFREISTC